MNTKTSSKKNRDELIYTNMQQKLDIVLIQSPVWLIESPPYNIALLSAILRKNQIRVKCFDLNIDLYDYCKNGPERNNWLDNETMNCWMHQDFIKSFIDKHSSFINDYISMILKRQPMAIGFTSQISSLNFSAELARLFKKKNPAIKIIFGGPACYKNCRGENILNDFPWVDAISFGEADDSLLEMIQNLKHKGTLAPVRGFAYRDAEGKIIDANDSPIVNNMDNLPPADFSDFNFEKYLKKRLPISTCRGCPNQCVFCNDKKQWKKYRFRSAENIYQEMVFQKERCPQLESFYFNDSIINGNIKELSKLCDLLISGRLGLQWCGQATIRPEMTKDLLAKLKLAGCETLSYGVESASDKVLMLMRKRHSRENAQEVIRLTYEAGIYVTFNIIVGFPGEGEEEFMETVDFLKENIKYAKHVAMTLLYFNKDTDIVEQKENYGVTIPQGEDWHIFWYTKDGKNNYEERMRRMEVYKSIVEDKSVLSLSNVDINIKVGDISFQKNDLVSALKYYRRAASLDKDCIKKEIIDKKISLCLYKQ